MTSSLSLSPEAIRVLGVLLEKEKTTPDYYPMTLNALVNGCNQSTNRNPVVQYDEMTVERALTELRDHSLTLRGVYAGSRVPKHRHNLDEVFRLSSDAQAVLTVLLLRGEQTLGEIRQRTDRMANFASLEECDEAVSELISHDSPLAVRVQKSRGHSQERIAHLLGSSDSESPATEPSSRPSFHLIEGEKEDNDEDDYFDDEDLHARVERLEKETTVLTHEIMSLRAEIDALKDPSA